MPVSVVRRAGGFVKAAGFHFHAFGGLLDGLQAERPDEPDGFAVHEAAHVLPPDERDVVAEARFVKFEQAMAVAVFFAAHGAEFDGLFGIIFLQAVGKILVDAGVLFFQRDGEREDFLFGEAVECFHKKIIFQVGRVTPCAPGFFDVERLLTNRLTGTLAPPSAGRGLPALPGC